MGNNTEIYIRHVSTYRVFVPTEIVQKGLIMREEVWKIQCNSISMDFGVKKLNLHCHLLPNFETASICRIHFDMVNNLVKLSKQSAMRGATADGRSMQRWAFFFLANGGDTQHICRTYTGADSMAYTIGGECNCIVQFQSKNRFCGSQFRMQKHSIQLRVQLTCDANGKWFLLFKLCK